jgi:hypothetical protein
MIIPWRNEQLQKQLFGRNLMSSGVSMKLIVRSNIFSRPLITLITSDIEMNGNNFLLPFSSALSIRKKNQSKLFIGKDHHESLFSSLEFFFSEDANHDENLDSENIISPLVEFLVNSLSQLELFPASISIVILSWTWI